MMKREKHACPLLQNPESYVPDTIDLLEDVKARDYWLTCLDQMVWNIDKKAKQLNPERADAVEISKKCREQYHEYIERIRSDPLILKPLSVRTLLELNEQILEENGFRDIWSYQKEKETAAAFAQFTERIRHIDCLVNFYDKWVELLKGLVAGNMFDWGARAVSDILETTNGFGLSHAMEKVQQRPWFCDDVNKWIDKIKKSPYQTAIVFVDNAGVDFVLGVLPFVRQFLIEGTSVLVAANRLPSLNDMTYTDLQRYFDLASEKCTVIQESLANNKLMAVDNGQSGPCLDLQNLTPDFCRLMEKVDLLVLEGMGRAIHTNLYAKFNVDSLKAATLKNEWLAKRLGTDQFAVIFKYEPAIPSPNT